LIGPDLVSPNISSDDVDRKFSVERCRRLLVGQIGSPCPDLQNIIPYNTWLHKYIAFMIAGGFGGLAGVLWAELSGQVSPEELTLTTSVDALLMVVLGGPGTLMGGVFGAAIVLFLREYLSTLVPWWQYALGGIYVLAIYYLPDGLPGLLRRSPGAAVATAEPVPAEELVPPSGGTARP
jgi:branched-chain amino acid transport system permease protein